MSAMAQVETGVLSPTGDALLLAALFLPFAPIGVTFNLYLIGLALGCPVDSALACEVAGLDFNHLFARSAGMLDWAAMVSRAGGVLLVYLLLLAGLAQFTTKGFRGRVVRTCAVTMWAGVIPLILALATVITRTPEQLCVSGPCDADTLLSSFAFYGNVFFRWLADIAVPLAVMMTGLLALTLGYAAVVKWIVLRVTKAIARLTT
jgi:hypothetical protein